MTSRTTSTVGGHPPSLASLSLPAVAITPTDNNLNCDPIACANLEAMRATVVKIEAFVAKLRAQPANFAVDDTTTNTKLGDDLGIRQYRKKNITS